METRKEEITRPQGVYHAAKGGAEEVRKMKPGWKVSGIGGFRCSWLLIAMLVACPAQAADAPARTESQLQAAAVLKSMAEYLAVLTAFSCTSTNNFEAVQADGQRIEFGETRRISLARPDRLRIDEVASNGASDLALFDGKQITVLSADDNVYAQAPQPPSIEDALVYFVRDLRMRMPLALLVSTHVRTELPTLAKEIDYVESTQIRGQTAHHLAGRGDSVDFQIWIAEGTSPLPLRIVTNGLSVAQEFLNVPNLEVGKDGKGTLKAVTTRVTLSDGPLSIFDTDGTAIIIHGNPDQGITGQPKSVVSGGPARCNRAASGPP